MQKGAIKYTSAIRPFLGRVFTKAWATLRLELLKLELLKA